MSSIHTSDGQKFDSIVILKSIIYWKVFLSLFTKKELVSLHRNLENEINKGSRKNKFTS